MLRGGLVRLRRWLHNGGTMTLHSLTVRGIPAPVLKVLRAAARANRRSLNAEVLVRLEAGAAGGSGRGLAAPTVVREAEPPPSEVRKAFEEADRARLRSDLALTPEQRVHLAEDLARNVPDGRPRPRFQRVMQFDRYEDYLDWRGLGGREP